MPITNKRYRFLLKHLLYALLATAFSASVLHAELPVACGGGNCNPAGGPNSWISHGSASLSTTTNAMTIHQQSQRATLNWQTFNIGSGNTVNFNQPSSDSAALNRVWDPNANPSKILGNLNANGRVYIINRNGILFGADAKINVHTLVGSTLDITDQIFQQGIATAINTPIDTDNNGSLDQPFQPAFAADQSTIVTDGDGVYLRSIVTDAQGQAVRFATGENGAPARFAVDENGEPLRDENGGYIPDAGGLYIPDAGGEFLDIKIEIQEGAEIATQNGGRVAIFSPTIINQGSIHTPDGQTLLAAGQEIYLVTDPDLRGLLVEVNTGGDVTNLGNILAEHGNITLAGLSVNQSGRVSATTSVNLEGTVRLLARDTITAIGNSATAPKERITVSNTGSIEFGKNSVTEVSLDVASAEAAVDEQAQPRSKIEVVGKTIHLREESQIIASGGIVDLNALADPSALANDAAPSLRDDGVYIQMERGSLIDVSGSDTELPMDRNELTIDIRSNELRDSPLQRDGLLRGETITIDVREGTPIADVSGALATIKRGVKERNKEGGKVVIKSEGQIDFQEDARIDVSGGSVSYRPGVIHTTQLLRNGRVIDISDASPSEEYDAILGFYSREHKKWGVVETWNVGPLGGGIYYDGYSEGANAGTVQFAAYQMRINGELIANTLPGQFQRELASRPTGGQLIIGLPNGSGLDNPNFVAPNIAINNDANPTSYDALVELFGSEDVLWLSSDYLNRGGFDRAYLYSNGRIVLADNSPLNVRPGGVLHLEAQVVDINSDINIPGGSIEIFNQAVNNLVPVSPEDENGEVVLAGSLSRAINIQDNVTLNTAALWINDSVDQLGGQTLVDFTSPVVINGGNITIQTIEDSSFKLGKDVTMDVSGGLWLQSNNNLAAGRGGSIDIKIGARNTIDTGGNLQLKGYAIKQGGELAISLPAIRVSGDKTQASLQTQYELWNSAQQLTADDAFVLPVFLFEQGGFSNFTLEAVEGSLVVEQNALITPRMQNLRLRDGYGSQPGSSQPGSYQPGSNGVAGITTIATLADEFRDSVDLTLAQDHFMESAPFDVELRIEPGASIITDPQALVSLFSDSRVVIEGTVSAQAGTINVDLEYSEEGLFDATRLIWLGQNAQLLAKGAFKPEFNELGLVLGEVLGGGSITLTSNSYIATAGNSLIDVSGAVKNLNIGTPTAVGPNNTQLEPVASDAGTIAIDTIDGLFLEGDIAANANKALGAAGGTLDVRLSRRALGNVTDPRRRNGYPDTDLATIYLTQEKVTNIPVDFVPGSPIDSRDPQTAAADNRYLLAGNGFLSAEQILAGGFDQVKLRANNTEGTRIAFNSDINLNVGRFINLAASQLDVSGNYNVSLSAPYISIGSTRDASLQQTSYDGVLNVDAGVVLDFINNSVFNGFSAVNLTSDGDIRLIQSVNDILQTEALIATAGDLSFQADQLYPTTLSHFLIQSDTLTILPGDSAPTPIMSALGKITVDSRIINQQGVLKAPQGQILLGVADAAGISKTEQIVLAAGSVTSVSGEGEAVLVGRIENDADWKYGQAGSTSTDLFTRDTQALAEKKVALQAQNVDIIAAELDLPAAIIDISGFGDIIAYEQIPGPGGSVDALLAENSRNTYAILPSLDNEKPPFDAVIYSGWDIQPGDAVTLLNGDQGLPAGEYALLPARYALLPGAYLVSFENGYRDLAVAENVVLPDGANIVPGYRSVIGSNTADSRTRGISIRPGSYARQQSEFRVTSISEVIPRRVGELELPALPLPGDAGHLVLIGDEQLNINGSVIADAQGRGAEVDIAAQFLAIVPELTGQSGTVEITGTQLAALEYDSLLLGGVRNRQGDQLTIDTQSNSVTVVSGSSIDVPEIMMVAKPVQPGSADPVITVEQGAQINATLATLDPGATDQITFPGDSAFLRIANNNPVDIAKTGSIETVTIDLQAGAVITVGNSLAVSASDINLESQLRMQGGSFSIDTSQINIGAGVPQGLGGVTIDEQVLASLGLNELILSSTGTLNLYGDIVIGRYQQDQVLQNLKIDAQGIRGIQTSGETLLAANEIFITNSNAAASPAPVDPQPGAARIRFAAQQVNSGAENGNIVIGDGDFSLQGYTDIAFETGREVIFSGRGNLSAAANVDFMAPRLTATAGSEKTISAGLTNSLSIRHSPAQAGVNLPAVTELGAMLSFNAGNISIDGRIELPSGIVAAHAVGGNTPDGSGSIIVGSNAVIDVSGRTENFSDQELFSPGGRVTLSSENENVEVRNGAMIDVSAATANYGKAGRVYISSRNGSAILDGELVGDASNHEDAGSIFVDTNSIGNNDQLNQFSLLNTRLNDGGFNNQRRIHVRSGKLTIDSEDIVTARHVTVIADGEDSGQISLEVNGTIDASGDQGGVIELYTRNGFRLSDTALLQANANLAGGKGGKIELASAIGDITFAPDVEMNVSGGANGAGGAVHLRALRSANNDDVRISGFNVSANVIGSENTVIEAVQVYENVSSINTQLAQWKLDTDNFMSFANQVKTRFGTAQDPDFHLLPGIEVRSTNLQDCADNACSLSLTSAWDLSGWRFWNGIGDSNDTAMITEPGVLTLRAKGNLNINASLSDGFNGLQPSSVIRSDNSWTYRLVGGADIGSGSALALLPSDQYSSASVNIANNTLVRTGTGDIKIAAANDVNLGNINSVVYTAGKLGFDLVTLSDGYSVTEGTNVIAIDGGDLSIIAGRDVNGPQVDRTQFILDWFKFQEKHEAIVYDGFVLQAGLESGWYTNFGDFRQNFAAFGGGNASMEAGGDINFVSVSVPTSIHHDVDNNIVNRYGQGNLDVSAQGDIHSSIFFVGDGKGSIQADGELTAGRSVTVSGRIKNVQSVFGLMGGALAVQSRGDLIHHSVFNPTRLINNGMYTYTDDSSVTLTSLGGNVEVHIPSSAITASTTTGLTNSITDHMATYPGIVDATAFNGDIRLEVDGGLANGFLIFPSSTGNLRLLAGNDVDFKGQIVHMLETDPNLIPRLGNRTPAGLGLAHSASRSPAIVHADDHEPIYIVAKQGDVTVAELRLPKQARIVAGSDYKISRAFLQNISDSDTSLVSAGRDITLQLTRDIISVGGPGQLIVQAGRNIDLGSSVGIETRGNLYYLPLPDLGADVTVMAGLSNMPDYHGFVEQYFVNSDEYHDEIADYLLSRGLTDTTIDSFLELELIDQQPMLIEAFFNELRESGRSALINRDNDYSRGFNAIATLFPGSDAENNRDFYNGNLSLFFSKIYTLDGGDINIFVPGGLVNAGLATQPVNAPVKFPSELGIVAQGPGVVNTFSYGDFQVNQSRVFTLKGGDILMWSSEANIDAGRGAKTSLSVRQIPPTCDPATGDCVVDSSAAISGSGIRAIETDPLLGAGDVDLFAPKGVVDAGDAGIGGFNVNIGAVTVIGAEDIDVGGIAMGVPVGDVNIGAALTGLSSVTSNAARDAEESMASNIGNSAEASATPLSDEALSYLEVVVIGLGEEGNGDENKETAQ